MALSEWFGESFSPCLLNVQLRLVAASQLVTKRTHPNARVELELWQLPSVGMSRIAPLPRCGEEHMPLTHAPGTPRPELDHFVFPMQDIRSGRVVICKISEEALRELSRSPTACLEVMFEQASRQAEEVASYKYDNGQSSPVITEGDVSPAAW